MPYQFNRPEDIEGLDTPMIAPWLIPKGMVQEYNTRLREWRVRHRRGNDYHDGWAVHELYTFPEIVEKLYNTDIIGTHNHGT